MSDRVQEAREAVLATMRHGNSGDTEYRDAQALRSQALADEENAREVDALIAAVRAERVEVPVETVERERLAALERWWKDHADDRQESAVLAEGYRNAGLAVTAALEAR